LIGISPPVRDHQSISRENLERKLLCVFSIETPVLTRVDLVDQHVLTDRTKTGGRLAGVSHDALSGRVQYSASVPGAAEIDSDQARLVLVMHPAERVCHRHLPEVAVVRCLVGIDASCGRHRSLDLRCRKLFADLVRERTFYELERRLSPSVKAALVEFVRALARIGKGTGKTAGLHRRTAREAMSRCYDAVPCWIMPTWRVAEQLPPELGAIDLVIIDEASQSDVTELPALLRGRRILVVGDDRQVSPPLLL
jgi:hypothetical protein